MSKQSEKALAEWWEKNYGGYDIRDPSPHFEDGWHSGYDAALAAAREEVTRLQQVIAYLYTEPWNFQQVCREELDKAGIRH